MSTERLQGLRGRLGRAAQRLADALARPKDEFIRDAARQRFELVLERLKSMSARLDGEIAEL